MAASVYLKEAANQVRNAVMALEDEIRAIQHDSFERESKLKNEADHEELKAIEDKIKAAAAHNDKSLEATYETQRVKLELDAKQKMKEAERQSAEAKRTVESKTVLVNKLKGAVSQLEQLAASAG